MTSGACDGFLLWPEANGVESNPLNWHRWYERPVRVWHGNFLKYYFPIDMLANNHILRWYFLWHVLYRVIYLFHFGAPFAQLLTRPFILSYNFICSIFVWYNMLNVNAADILIGNWAPNCGYTYIYMYRNVKTLNFYSFAYSVQWRFSTTSCTVETRYIYAKSCPYNDSVMSSAKYIDVYVSNSAISKYYVRLRVCKQTVYVNQISLKSAYELQSK